MAFENNTNLGRVEKMVETLRLIETSAASNRATPAQIKTLLAPLIEALATCADDETVWKIKADATGPSHRPALAGLKPGERAALHLADGASLRQLIAALMGRLDAQAARLAGTDAET